MDFDADEEESTEIVRNPLVNNLRAAQRDRCTLVILAGPTPGRMITIEGNEAVLGRGRTASARIDDGGLSRQHARIFRSGEGWFVEDLGSTNGTYVAGLPVIKAVRVKDGDRIQIGQSTLLRVTLQDEQEQKQSKTLYESTVRDPLTGVYNRRHLDNQLSAEFAYAVRHGAPLSVMLLDVDHFKSVNDDHGHPAGDAVLRALAETLNGLVRTEDVVARYGGEEFAVVTRGISGANALMLAERIRRRVEAMSVPVDGGQSLKITVSIGIATNHGNIPFEDPAVLLKACDEALYKAKETGRNRCVHANP